ncbi:MAG: RNA polymerase sigma factor [Bacteroidales bacterium]|jgi:RNA polymerase sigma-70 factor (ECF subfamily)
MFNHHINIGNTQYDFKEIFNDFFASQLLFARRILKNNINSEDIVQEVFLKLWKAEPVFPNEISFKAYLYLSTRNHCIDFLRKKKLMFSNIEIAGNIEEEANEVLKEEAFRLLDKAILELPPQSRRVIQYAMEGLSIQETAVKLSVSVNTVKTLKSRAYKILRDSFGEIFLILLSPFF